MQPVVAVEEVSGAPTRRRFLELPHVLDGRDPRFAPLVLAWERFRVDRHRNPALDGADWALLLARRAGRPVGRISVRIDDGSDSGTFGHWWVDEDPAVADALLEAATTWLAERGARTVTGPLTMTVDQELGVQVAGHDAAGRTGRPWQPPRLAEALADRGFEVVATRATWRLPVPPLDPSVARRAPERRSPTGAPDAAGPYADPRLTVPGGQAVPDVAPILRTSRWRGALEAGRRARAGTWDTAVVVGTVERPERTVPALLAAAAVAGYREVVAPWSPDGGDPEAVHATFTRPC
ncbi:MAG: hypothetical protein ACO1PW_06530 [Actinomycetota bacterium]